MEQQQPSLKTTHKLSLHVSCAAVMTNALLCQGKANRIERNVMRSAETTTMDNRDKFVGSSRVEQAGTSWRPAVWQVRSMTAKECKRKQCARGASVSVSKHMAYEQEIRTMTKSSDAKVSVGKTEQAYSLQLS